MNNKTTQTFSEPAQQAKQIRVPFNKPCLAGAELTFIADAVSRMQLAGNGCFTQNCQEWLEKMFGSVQALLTHSGTAALEMASLLIDTKPGDEIIMPSFTFVTTASSFVLRGAVPVFVDIRPDTLNIDEKLIESAITKKTKAIVPVHYAGVSCDMSTIMEIARCAGSFVIEDAAHGILANWNGKPVGSQGDLAALSFHETKNVIAGEGGALLINNENLVEKSHIVWEKGTNRREFMLGIADKYTWKELGSSFPPSELTAAFLWAQMQHAEELTGRRRAVWNKYHEGFLGLESAGTLKRPTVTKGAEPNGHIYYLLLESRNIRDALIHYLDSNQIAAVFHYVPLHSSPAGRKFGRAMGTLAVTDSVADRLIRLPLWADLSEPDIELVIQTVHRFFEK